MSAARAGGGRKGAQEQAGDGARAAFERAMLRLPDQAFLEIARNYLGEFKTPFNKHSIIERLANFLGKPERRAALVDLLGEREARIASAVLLLGAPPFALLAEFLEPEEDAESLELALLNLGERLVLCSGEEPSSVMANPILEEELRATVLDPALLVGTEESVEPVAAPPLFQDAQLAAFHALAAEGALSRLKGGELKAKGAKALRDRAGGDEGEWNSLAEALSRLMLLSEAEDGRLAPRAGNWRRFAALPARTRALLVAASSLAHGKSLSEVKAFARDSLELLERMPASAWTSRRGLERLALLARPGRDAGQHRRLGSALECLERAGLAGKRGEYYARAARPAEASASPTAAMPTATVQSDFSILCPASTPLADLVAIAGFADLARADSAFRFEMSAGSFRRALESGQDPAVALAELGRLAGGRPLPANLLSSAESWKRDWEDFRLYRGYVLAAGERFRLIVEHSKALEGVPRRQLAPGVFLFPEGEGEKLEKALAKLGLGFTPTLAGAGEPPPAEGGLYGEGEGPYALPPTAGPRGNEAPLEDILARARATANARADRGPAREDLRRALRNKLAALGLPEEEGAELGERIERGLILDEEQLASCPARPNLPEAKGLDYLGKLRVINQALAARGALLEVLYRDSDGSPERMVVQAAALDKGGGQVALKAVDPITGEERRLQVNRITLVRLKRASLFF